MRQSKTSLGTIAASAVVAAFVAFALAGCAVSQSAGGPTSGGASDSDSAPSSASESPESGATGADPGSGDATGDVPDPSDVGDAASDDAGSDAATSADPGSGDSAQAEGSAAASASAASNGATPSKMQKIGNSKVGYLRVPATWENRTSDVDPNTVEAYDLVYYVDPTSQRDSQTLGNVSYSEAVQLTVQSAPYTEVARDIAEGFEKSSANFNDTDSGEITINGRNAILVTSVMTKDDLQLATIVIDRDGDGRTTVAITMNCGTGVTTAMRLIQYADTWTY